MSRVCFSRVAILVTLVDFEHWVGVVLFLGFYLDGFCHKTGGRLERQGRLCMGRTCIGRRCLHRGVFGLLDGAWHGWKIVGLSVCWEASVLRGV